MQGEDESRKTRLNTNTFAIKIGKKIYVTVPVLLYEPSDDPARTEGYEYMNRMFSGEGAIPCEVMEITSEWAGMDPHNSKRLLDPHNSILGSDRDDD